LIHQIKLEIASKKRIGDAIKNSSVPLVPGEEGLETLKIAQAAVESYKNNKKIDLEA